jgi:hypothetical protein
MNTHLFPNSFNQRHPFFREIFSKYELNRNEIFTGSINRLKNVAGPNPITEESNNLRPRRLKNPLSCP